MVKRRKRQLDSNQWHEALSDMVPAYDALVGITDAYGIRTVQYQAARIAIDTLNDLAKLHGRPQTHYFGSIPNDTRASSMTIAGRGR